MISNAYAQTAAGASGFGLEQITGFLPIILMFGVLYFIMVRPQMKRAKETKAMIDAIQKGDEVITAGGILGRIVKAGDTYLTIEVGSSTAGAVEMQIQRGAVQTVLPKGTLKAL
ncbi:preprotein translocase subunit YajC [soil metagenome]